MKSHINRLKKLERKIVPFKREFIVWKGQTWTEAEMAEEIRLHPKQRIFWRSLAEYSSQIIEAAKRDGTLTDADTRWFDRKMSRT